MPNKKGKSSIVSQIVTAVLIALLVGGTAPWWWKLVSHEKDSAPHQPQIRPEQPQDKV